MYSKTFLVATCLFIVITGYLSCDSNPSGPDTNLEFTEFHINNPTSLFGLLGIDLTNLHSYYLVDWTFLIDFSAKTKAPYQRLFARGFQSGQSAQSFNLIGVDMGQVAFEYTASDSMRFLTQLNQTFSPAAGFTYNFVSSQNSGTPRFFTGDSLRFTRTGAATFDPLEISLTAPMDSVSFLSPPFNSSINTNADLRLTWQGGESSDQVVLLTFQPFFETNGGGGFLSGTHEFLATNPGEITLSQTSLQTFLDHAEDELMQQGDSNAELVGIFVYIALPVIQEVADGNNRNLAMAFSSDQLFLGLPGL